MDVVRVAEPQYLPWSMQQVFAQVKYGRLLDLFYNETPTGHVLCAIEPWMETVGDADTALSISCLLRYQDAFPEIDKPPFAWSCVEDNICLTVNPATLELNAEMNTYIFVFTDRLARLHLTHKEWSFTPAQELDLGQLGPGCTAHAAGAGSPYRSESSHNDWYRAVMTCDASRVDAFLGLLISAMADEEARGEMISSEDAAQLLYRHVRPSSGLSIGQLTRLDPPLPMDMENAEPGSPPAKIPSDASHRDDMTSHNNSSSSTSSLSGAETVRAHLPSCNGGSYHSEGSVGGDPSFEEWLADDL